MPANKYLSQSGGVITEIQATDASTGATEAGKIVALDSTGKLASTLMPVGLGAETDTVPAYENLAAGDFVNLFPDSGTVKARKADASAPNAGKMAHGFVLAAVTAPANATVYRPSQSNTQLSGMTPGAKQYLSTVGARTETAPTTTGHTSQFLGIALNDSTLSFNPNDPIILA